jgi:flagellar hook protein FlgE
VNDQGLKLVGYPADTSGFVQVGQPGVLQVPTAGVAAKATSKIGIELNLSQQSAVTDAAKATPPSINFSDPSTYNTTAELNVYDPKGTSIPVTFYLQRTAADSNQWNVYAKANGTSLGGTDAVPAPITTLTFDGSGTLTSTPTMSLDIPATNTGAGEIPTTPIAGIALDWSNSTEYAGKSAATSTTQDGFAPGTYAGMVIDAAGVMTVRYSNGQSKAAGQLELATFRNPQGLEPVGGNGWKRTATSGDPVAGIPGTGNLGVLQSGALEESNVDLTGELVNMITAQRSYQANAQTIKTMDQVLQTLVSLR